MKYYGCVTKVDVSQLRLELFPWIDESSDSDDSSPLCLTPAESRIDQEVQLNIYGDYNELYSPLPLPPTLPFSRSKYERVHCNQGFDSLGSDQLKEMFSISTPTLSTSQSSRASSSIHSPESDLQRALKEINYLKAQLETLTNSNFESLQM